MPDYAVTVHKSQGSEYLPVVIPVLIQHYAMLHRNLRWRKSGTAASLAGCSERKNRTWTV